MVSLIKRLFNGLLLVSMCLGPARALEWSTQQLIVKAAPFQATTEASFAFTNRGPEPVTITRIDTSCDCLDAETSTKVVAPGTTGQIRARFTVGGLHGTYHRTITVTSDDAKVPVALTVELVVPEIATLEPRSLNWPLHGPAETKSVTINIVTELELTLGEVVPTNDLFAVRLETVTAGRAYLLHVTPRNTDRAVSAALRIHATTGDGHALIFSAYGNVR